MRSVSERYRDAAARFSARVAEVPSGAWESPAPCEGWVARDVVRHLVEWVPGFLRGAAGMDVPELPSVDDDPAAAWASLDRTLQGFLDDPVIAARTFETQGQTKTVEDAIGSFVLGDVVVHTWDLARAAGLDEALDPDEVHAMLEGMAPMDEVLRKSGHFGPKVDVPDDADEQTRLLAFLGRRP